jgi:hypothetical protein
VIFLIFFNFFFSLAAHFFRNSKKKTRPNLENKNKNTETQVHGPRGDPLQALQREGRRLQLRCRRVPALRAADVLLHPAPAEPRRARRLRDLRREGRPRLPRPDPPPLAGARPRDDFGVLGAGAARPAGDGRRREAALAAAGGGVLQEVGRGEDAGDRGGGMLGLLRRDVMFFPFEFFFVGASAREFLFCFVFIASLARERERESENALQCHSLSTLSLPPSFFLTCSS